MIAIYAEEIDGLKAVEEYIDDEIDRVKELSTEEDPWSLRFEKEEESEDCKHYWREYHSYREFNHDLPGDFLMLKCYELQ